MVFPCLNHGRILDGKALSQRIVDRVRLQVQQRLASGRRAPTLAVVLVGQHPASTLYVHKKKQRCADVGIRSSLYALPEGTTEAQLLSVIAKLNEDEAVDGILVQLPLPDPIDTASLFEAIDPRKDVDGFHPYNMGRLALKMPVLRPCTPRGVMLLLEATGINITGKDAVVVGASNIVGRPQALELLLAQATVTVCHYETQHLSDKVRTADIVVVAAGSPHLVKGDWIKPGAIVVDVGINRLKNGKLCGDVLFEAVRERASWITPVPGGVGPMTVAVLLENTLLAADLRGR